MRVRVSSQRGLALVLTLLAMALFATLGATLVLSTSFGRLVETNYEDAVNLANASDAALELAVRELAAIADWNDVLSGVRVSRLVDGGPGRRVLADGVEIDLAALTNELTCGRLGWCSDAQVRATTLERPWGANNPRWRLFLHVPLPPGPRMPRVAHSIYVVVWIGDDAREIDGNSENDDEGAGEEGRYLVRARAEAFGVRGGRHSIEAELARMCSVEGEVESCRPGVRVHAWRSVTAEAR
jgi:hypothetical protein